MRFISYIRCAAERAASPGHGGLLPAELEPLLNGEPYKAFRTATEISIRRSRGCFFTGPVIADQLANSIAATVRSDSKIMDPTCGIGDLLLAYARLLPLQSSLQKTLKSWGTCLFGLDKQENLIALAKIRLVMLARSRGSFSEPVDDIDRYFPNITIGDMFASSQALKKADAFLFNPPFGSTRAPNKTEWASGNVNLAALFLVKLLHEKRANASVAAVLPEVLRSGTRYSKLRQYISQQMYIEGFAVPRGRFDRWTDVDVFETLLRRGAGKLWNDPTVKSSAILGDYFEVHVGAVVPHRHKKTGPWRKYICAKTTPKWLDRYVPEMSRRFDGPVVLPPFVVIRRTSSPSDRQRAVATIVVGDNPVAVENHLVVLLPKSGGYKKCKQVLDVLSAEVTSDHLNRTMRCRHLTTSAVIEIPWIPDNG
jgi:N-6 DNA Methylase